jgi:hypothetical protein
MADIAPKLVELSADKLRALHERLHKSQATPEVLEVHHLAINEMLRRGLEAPANDAWDEFEILVDTLKNANLEALKGSLPTELVEEVIKSTGSAVANVQLFLTTTGYEMRLEELEDVNKMIRRENGKWTVYDEEGKRPFGTYDTKAEAEKRLAQMHQFKKAETFTPPKAVRSAARRALEWIADGKAGSGFTGVGRARANQLASGEQVTMATLKRMKSFFSRHEVDKNAVGFSQGEKGFPSAGRVAWDAWGGDAGFAWAESMVARDEKEVEKHLQGKHDQQRHAPGYADKIAEGIINGEHPSVMPLDVGFLMSEFAKRTDHPDLTELKVNGTMLYGDEGMGIARKDMPQVPAERRGEFLSELQGEGVTVEEEAVDPKTLKPIQKEVSASRSGAIYNRYKEEGGIPTEQRILISKDGFVIDGHHTWGAAVAFSFENTDATLPVYRIGLTAKEALDRSLEWTKAQGIEGQAIDAKAPAQKSKIIWKHLEGEHDQNAHGSWAGATDKSLPLIEDVKASSNKNAQAVAAATALRNRVLSVEPSITGMMQDLAKMSGGELVGLANRVKTTDSLARKIDADATKDFGGDHKKAAENISDAIRYTMTMPDSEYTSGTERTVAALESAGFKIRTKNFWQSGDPYDGANVKATKDGITVEIQLHTPRSLKVKESELHPIYEKYRVETNEIARQGYWTKMVDIAKSIPRPTRYEALLAMGTLVVQQYETARQAGLIKSTPVGKMLWNLERGIAVCVIS